MPAFLERVEAFLGRSLTSVEGHDSKLFIKSPPFKTHPNSTVAVTSPECEESMSELKLEHTPLGANRFPELQWTSPTPTEGASIAEYLLVVEDPDAPLLSLIVHGIYYAIPPTKTLLQPAHFVAVPEARNALEGGFNFGLNKGSTSGAARSRCWAMGSTDICFRSWR